MKQVFIGCGAVTVFFVIIISLFSYVTYNSIKNFPDDAKREVVYKKYEHLIKQIDENIAKSDTILNLASNLEKMEFPENTIYLALEKTKKDKKAYSGINEDKEIIEIIKKYDGASKSISILNGSGHGLIGDRYVQIIDYEITKFKGLKSCIVYIEQVKTIN